MNALTTAIAVTSLRTAQTPLDHTPAHVRQRATLEMASPAWILMSAPLARTPAPLTQFVRTTWEVTLAHANLATAATVSHAMTTMSAPHKLLPPSITAIPMLHAPTLPARSRANAMQGIREVAPLATTSMSAPPDLPVMTKLNARTPLVHSLARATMALLEVGCNAMISMSAPKTLDATKMRTASTMREATTVHATEDGQVMDTLATMLMNASKLLVVLMRSVQTLLAHFRVHAIKDLVEMGLCVSISTNALQARTTAIATLMHRVSTMTGHSLAAVVMDTQATASLAPMSTNALASTRASRGAQIPLALTLAFAMLDMVHHSPSVELVALTSMSVKTERTTVSQACAIILWDRSGAHALPAADTKEMAGIQLKSPAEQDAVTLMSALIIPAPSILIVRTW